MSAMAFEEIEKIYDELAEAIDRAGVDNEALFLAKLAITLGHQVGDSAVFKAAVATALQDLPDPSPSRRAISTKDSADAAS